MTETFKVYVGSMGSGVFMSDNGGRSFYQAAQKMAVAPWGAWIDVRAVEVSPHDPTHILAGSHIGVHLSEDGGKSFEFISSPFNYKQVWSVSWHPDDPNILFAGIAGWDTDYPLFRSTDRGKSWQQLPMYVPAFTPPIGASHVTRIQIDPASHDTIWATCEIYGTLVSHDRGDSWTKIRPLGDHVLFGDNHGVALSADGKVYITSPCGVFISTDRGSTFRRHIFPDIYPSDDNGWLPAPVELKRKLGLTQYVRHIALKPDETDVVYACTGDTTPGRAGLLQRSRDAGQSWDPCEFPTPANSHVSTVAVHPAVPHVVVCASLYGQIFVSTDGGDKFFKSEQEFGEIRGLAIGPA
ncbi:WD40/YVTN/BNR-like repeat-containing protein [Novosphingobium pentaromativorans]|uniref:Uncharacterized protein n=1 Tax=Novosphingobium pentaromativorans US6-1 TaxID=1088721 RepID=G6EGE8_9SPHN|nr:hypothetical protein [Novosphingobium pentaromativorans]AIT82127.1 hypothetical protein JI59_21595 [Novosphingobium pentaromativorans US6-1]EHJ59599.1 hypothetical protein NSU_3482 [Novosphingobium pentaromativorans US6-1]